MKTSKLFFLALCITVFSFVMYGQKDSKQDRNRQERQQTTFKFVMQKESYGIPPDEEQWSKIFSLIDQYQTDISEGRMRIEIVGYSASIGRDNRSAAEFYARSMRTEIINRKGLREYNFIMSSRIVGYEGDNEVVVVSFNIPRNRNR